MAPDVRFIPDAAQRNAGQLSIQGVGYGQGNGRLAHTGRTHQTEDLPLPFRVHLPDGDGFQNPLLHLFQTVVIPVQHLPGRLYIDPLLSICTPWQLQKDVQIIPDHRRL